MASDRRPQKPTRLRRIQSVMVALLCVAGVINYLDRSSLSIANTTVRADLGLSGTRIGALLSVFSLAYGISQLPSGLLLDRLGARVILGAGMFLWSLAQTATGWVTGFGSFLATRISLAAGEAPFVVAGVKGINEWFPVRDRGLPMGTVNASTTLGQALAPPILTGIMLAFGWRSMFVFIGMPGLVISVLWYVVYRDRRNRVLTTDESHYLNEMAPGDAARPISVSEWTSLFRLRTMWGMMLGFGGVNYTVWLYIAWLPGYLEAARHVSLARTGWLAMIPFLFGSLGMLVNGLVADLLVRRGVEPMKSRKILIIAGMTSSSIFTLFVAHASSVSWAISAICAALFFIHFAGTSGWGLVQVAAPPRMVASVGCIQNFGSFICASLGPIITGWLLDRTHSFDLALTLCSLAAFLGALSYLLIVKDPIPGTQAVEMRAAHAQP
jgi:MFS transporter, ACS family, L-galactonate transporter